jgi:hypothetical protein
MESNERIVLNSFKSKNDVNLDIQLKQDFHQSHNVIPIEPIDEEINIPEYFSIERENSTTYRFLGNINFLASNVLFNWDGAQSYQDVLTLMDYDGGEPDSTDEYVFTQDEILKEKNGWFYYNATGETSSCEKVYLEPVPERFSAYNSQGNYNWNVWLTYPKEVDLVPLQFNGVPLSDGIAVYSGTTVTIDDRPMTALICSINHGLSVGDEIIIRSNPIFPATNTGYEGTYNVYALGFGDGSYETNTFIIDYVIPAFPAPPANVFNNTRTSFKRLINGYESEYYGRWFEKITNFSDVELYETAFATNIYNDQIFSYNFKRDIDLSPYVDYLGRPITEVYVTFVKNQDYYSGGGQVWTPVESGLKTVTMSTEYDINTITSVSLNDSIESNVNALTNYIFGDIIEYNEVAQIENVLEVAYHRFNTVNREDNNFLEGYYYKSHYKNQVRKFSTYVNVEFENVESIPFYAVNMGDGRYIWRDIEPNDYSNGSAIPFLNGCHYIYNSINLYLQRQDPCNVYFNQNINVVTGRCEANEQLTEVPPTNNFCE